MLATREQFSVHQSRIKTAATPKVIVLIISMAALTNRDWRAVLLFLFKEGETPTRSAERLKEAFGSCAPARSTISKWFGRFSEGEETLDDEERSGRPTSQQTDENVEHVWEVVRSDRRVSFDELENQTSLSRGTLHRILHDQLHLSKVSARWVPRLLTEEQKDARVMNSAICLYLMRDYGDQFWNRFITADETPLPHYMPESKRQCMQWIKPGERPPVHAKSAPSIGKFQVTVFWDCDGIIHVDFCPPRQTINAEYYSNLLQTVHKLLPRKRPGKTRRVPLFLQDNARVHTANKSMETIREIGWQLLPHPAYSPDLAPSDYHLFGPMKEPLRGVRFKDQNEIERAVKDSLSRFPTEWFREGIQKLEKRWTKCLELEGDYVEK